MSDAADESSTDRRADARAFLTVASLVMAAFAVGAAVQTVFVFRPARMSAPVIGDAGLDFLLRVTVNLVAITAALALAHVSRLAEVPTGRMVRFALGIAAVTSAGRFLLQCTVGLYPDPTVSDALVEIGSTAMVVLLGLGLGRGQVQARRRLREHARLAAEQRLLASSALVELAAEESRVRGEVAADLHGTLQGRLVIVLARIDALLRRVDAGPPRTADGDAMVDDLRRIRDDLDVVREEEVRALSHRLQPVGVTLGLAHALRMLLRNIPPEIEVEAVVDPAFETGPRRTDAEALARRVAIVRAAEEALSNALRHGGATRIRLRLERGDDAEVRLSVDDDGSGLPGTSRPPALPGRGVEIVTRRIEALGGSISLEPSTLGGARFVAVLP